MARKARSSLLGSGVIVGLLALCAVYFTLVGTGGLGRDAEPKSSDHVGVIEQTDKKSADSQGNLESAMAQLRNRAKELAAQRNRPARGEPEETLGFPRETVTFAQDIFDEMWAVRGLVHTQEQREDAARRFLEAPRALELAYRTATDPDFARQVFDEQQAEARFYSIVVLEEAAKASVEQQELLKNAVAVVRRGLVSSDTFDAGRGEDFRGLLTAYTGLIALNDINSDTLETLGYDDGLSTEMKQIYYETVFSVLWKREGIEVAEARFKEIFVKS